MSRSTDVINKTKGPAVAVNICFNEDSSVDFGAIHNYIDSLVTKGVPVILLSSGSSEYSFLSQEDIWRITEVIAKANAGRSLFIAASGAWDIRTCASYLKHADDVGADAVKIQPHPEIHADRDRYLEYFNRIRTGSEIPLFLLDPPLSLAIEMASDERIVGAKVHSHDDYYQMTRDTKDLDFATICAGQMGTILFGHQLGSPAYLCTFAPFLPSIALEFFEKLDTGQYEDAIKFVAKYEDPWLKTAVDVDWMYAVKIAIHMAGLYPNNRVAPPYKATTPEQVKKVHDSLKQIFGPALFE